MKARNLIFISIVGLGFGIVGTLLALAGSHIYEDHKNLHALVNMVVQQQQKKP